MKSCSRCHVEKDDNCFGKNLKLKSGLNSWCRSCYAEHKKINAESIKKYNQENIEKTREKNRRYNAENYKRCQETTSAWRKQNDEKVKASSSKWRSKNKEKIAAARAEYKKNFPEKIKESRTNYRVNNPEKAMAATRNYAARKRKAAGSHSGDDVLRLLELQKWKCAACHKKVTENYHVDHIKALATGGSNSPENLQILCPKCNCSKGAKHPVDFMQQMGFLI